MKYVNAIAISAAAIWVVGCASPSKVALNDLVGPCNRTSAHDTSDGFIQVHSAREQVPIDLNTQEFFWNNDYGRNEFLYGSGLSAYTVLDEDGAVCQHVRRNRGINEQAPAVVKLAPGRYTVEAEAEEAGGITVTVLVPLVVESGQTTVIRLDPAWKRLGEERNPGQVVALADDRIIGCRAELGVGQRALPAPLVATSRSLPAKP